MRWIPALLLTLGCTAGDEGADYYDLVLTPDPDPFVSGEEIRMEIDVTDAVTGDAVTGATVTADPWMPEHGHGTSGAVEVIELGDGLYEGAWTFSMSGYWEVTITVDGAAGVESELVGYDVE